MSQAQEFVNIYLWGFIESRDGIPTLVEAYGDLVGEVAAVNALQRALELGFSPRQATDPTSLFSGTDEAGPFELRQVWMEGVPVNAESLFEEANDLADAVAGVLRALSSDGLQGIEAAVEKARARLSQFDVCWQIERS